MGAIFFGILFVFTAVIIIGLILLQEGKGGGIAAMGGGGAMDGVVGVRNPLRRMTIVFSLIFIVLVVSINVGINKSGDVKLDEGFKKTLGLDQPEKKTPDASKIPHEGLPHIVPPTPLDHDHDQPRHNHDQSNKEGTAPVAPKPDDKKVVPPTPPTPEGTPIKDKAKDVDTTKAPVPPKPAQ